MTGFGARLDAAVAQRGRLCVGIDPHVGLLEKWGLRDDVDGVERFSMTAVEALAPVVGVVKPQSAFFERHGSRGVAVLERVIATAREAGALVLLDVKRGDIDSTSQAYADAYLDPASSLASDAITASPFLGFGSLDPMIETARRHDGGVFVLALTSNPQGPEIQHARVGERTVAGVVLDHLRSLNAAESALTGSTGFGSYGAVVGATIATTTEDLDFGGPILAPGFGAQGGTVADMQRVFGAASRWVLPSSSRSVLGAGPDPVRLRDAALRDNEAVGLLGS